MEGERPPPHSPCGADSLPERILVVVAQVVDSKAVLVARDGPVREPPELGTALGDDGVQVGHAERHRLFLCCHPVVEREMEEWRRLETNKPDASRLHSKLGRPWEINES